MYPVRTLNSVVLPAPFGPMTPKVTPGGMSRSTSARGRTPPNDLFSPSMRSRALISPATGRLALLGSGDLLLAPKQILAINVFDVSHARNLTRFVPNQRPDEPADRTLVVERPDCAFHARCV